MFFPSLLLNLYSPLSFFLLLLFGPVSWRLYFLFFSSFLPCFLFLFMSIYLVKIFICSLVTFLLLWATQFVYNMVLFLVEYFRCSVLIPFYTLNHFEQSKLLLNKWLKIIIIIIIFGKSFTSGMSWSCML